MLLFCFVVFLVKWCFSFLDGNRIYKCDNKSKLDEKNTERKRLDKFEMKHWTRREEIIHLNKLFLQLVLTVRMQILPVDIAHCSGHRVALLVLLAVLLPLSSALLALDVSQRVTSEQFQCLRGWSRRIHRRIRFLSFE